MVSESPICKGLVCSNFGLKSPVLFPIKIWYGCGKLLTKIYRKLAVSFPAQRPLVLLIERMTPETF